MNLEHKSLSISLGKGDDAQRGEDVALDAEAYGSDAGTATKGPGKG